MFASLISQFTAPMLGSKVQLAPSLVNIARKTQCPCLFWNRRFNRISKFWSRTFHQFLHVHYPEWTFFQLFSIIILICALCILFPWNLNIIFVIYHLLHLVTWFLHTLCMQSMRILARLLDEYFHYQKIVQS